MNKDDSADAPEIVIDRTTRELRYYFKLIAIKSIKAEVAEVERQAKAEKKAKRKAEREARKASNKPRIKRDPPAPPVRHCYRCKSEMPQLAVDDPPKLCFKCAEDERSRSSAIKSRQSVEYSEIEVFKGGAPGLGKRH
ncbi:hypothetical protein ACS8E9_09490 [Pseudomonas neustonica]|uniref:hypothetical protein n=1 Tax=Pseudomonas neustonica TaxID=2487346 RepID=UPI003F474B2E